ncbi:hypothetical protein LS482_12135 [Sinomicrobium kalidii]|nr:hypothetical protein [Sinomicrobium kalidii]UGU14450.1 hypothetical protein LS482_12135 [Sinomicrobium kalidii]
MSKSQLNDFLGVKSFDALNTDSVMGGLVEGKKKKKDKEKEIDIKVDVDL